MKQADGLSGGRVHGHGDESLVNIAGAAGQRPIVLQITATLFGWNDVFHLEGKIERLLRCPAILAALARAGGYGRMIWVHDEASFIKAAPRSPAARVSSSMS